MPSPLSGAEAPLSGGGGPLPELKTFRAKPSWCTTRGRIDRSATIPIRHSQLWRLAKFTPAPTFAGREAHAVVDLTADMLHDILCNDPPRELVGDWRTGKSHALRPAGFDPKLRWRIPLSTFAQNAPGLHHGLTDNPNRGACRSKCIGIPVT